MSVTAGDISTTVAEAVAIGETILAALEGADPAVALPAEAAGGAIALAGELAQKALAAWSAASGVPITVDSVMALMPDETPLDPPDAPSATS